jgi:hypothetical protein
VHLNIGHLCSTAGMFGGSLQGCMTSLHREDCAERATLDTGWTDCCFVDHIGDDGSPSVSIGKMSCHKWHYVAVSLIDGNSCRISSPSPHPKTSRFASISKVRSICDASFHDSACTQESLHIPGKPKLILSDSSEQ